MRRVRLRGMKLAPLLLSIEVGGWRINRRGDFEFSLSLLLQTTNGKKMHSHIYHVFGDSWVGFWDSKISPQCYIAVTVLTRRIHIYKKNCCTVWMKTLTIFSGQLHLLRNFESDFAHLLGV